MKRFFSAVREAFRYLIYGPTDTQWPVPAPPTKDEWLIGNKMLDHLRRSKFTEQLERVSGKTLDELEDAVSEQNVALAEQGTALINAGLHLGRRIDDVPSPEATAIVHELAVEEDRDHG